MSNQSSTTIDSPKANRRKPLTLAAMSLGFAVVQLDVTVVNVAVKSIGSTFGEGVAGLQWVVNAYTLALASLILTAGAAGDRFGAKRVFTAGFAIFMAASLGCAMAPTIFVLIASRTLQGLGAAILVPSSLALLNHAYREERERTYAIGVWAAGASVALAAGPLIGGVLIATVGWRCIFLINIPLGLLGICLTYRYVEETTTTERRLDYIGQILAIIALAIMAGTTIEAGTLGWTNVLVVTGFAFALLAAILFAWVENRRQDPMLPLSFFRNRTFTSATLIGLLINVAYYGLIFVLSLYFQQIKSYTALKTGLAFLPMTLVVLIANLCAGRMAEWIGSRFTIAIGQALFALGCFALIRVSAQTSYTECAAQLLAIGAGIGITVPPMTSMLLGTVEKQHSGIASGVLNSARQAGSVLGVSIFGSLIAQRNDFVQGFHRALLISAFALAAGCSLALLIPEGESRTRL